MSHTCHGVCSLSMIPLRAEPSERAEMVSQLLFGDAYQIVEERDLWLLIQTADCGYEGWINRKLHNRLHPEDVEGYCAAEKFFVEDPFFYIRDFETRVSFPIFCGSSFPYPQGELLILGDAIFVIHLPEKKELPPHPSLSAAQYKLLSFVSGYLGAPYLWGGRTPAGIDCSALLQNAFKSIGIALPRDASQQAVQGITVASVEAARPGDAAFFHDGSGRVVHTGLVTSPGEIIHASGKVAIDTLDTTGIFNRKEKQYTHFLHAIQRFLP